MNFFSIYSKLVNQIYISELTLGRAYLLFGQIHGQFPRHTSLNGFTVNGVYLQVFLFQRLAVLFNMFNVYIYVS